MEEQNARRRRQQEKTSILYWLVRTRNSLSPSSSRSFRAQSHWSYTPGQCVNSGHFLRVHLSCWMCNQFRLHHKFRIDSGRTKFKQGKTDSIFSGCEIPWTRNTKIRTSLTWPNHVLHGTSRKRGKDTKTRCIGSIYNLLNEKGWCSLKQDVMEKDVLFGREGTKHSTRTGRPVGGQQSTQLEERDIDFRVPGLSHAVVKEAENFSVQELVKKKIESHPHREAFQADLQQNNVCNPFSNNSKAMIRELGNLELFELCETIPKVQCSHCLLCWKQGNVYCTCGHFLVESESRRKRNKLRLDALSIPHYVIKKGRCHGARHGKTEEQKEYHIAWNAWKRCCKRVDSQGEHFTGIHDRFLRDPVYRESQLAIGWTEQKCVEMDELAKQNHTYHLSTEEFQRYQGQWYLTLNKSGKNAPMKLRPDFRAAVSLKNRLHRESGEEVAEPISPAQYRRWHSSSSDSWWDTSDWSWWSS